MTIIFSILRSLLLTLLLSVSLLLPGPASPFNPLSPLSRFDIFVVDQQSVCVPFLRLFTGTRVVFYCHFPDKLLSGGWEVNVDTQGNGVELGSKEGLHGRSLLKRVYRWPIDKLEEWTTGQLTYPLLSNGPPANEKVNQIKSYPTRYSPRGYTPELSPHWQSARQGSSTHVSTLRLIKPQKAKGKAKRIVVWI